MWDSIMDEQFDLTYYMNFTFLDTEGMSAFERKGFYNRLLRRKEAEIKNRRG